MCLEFEANLLNNSEFQDSHGSMSQRNSKKLKEKSLKWKSSYKLSSMCAFHTIVSKAFLIFFFRLLIKKPKVSCLFEIYMYIYWEGHTFYSSTRLCNQDILPACVSVHQVCVVPTEPRRGPWSLQNWDGCEPPCGCWEVNLGPLQELVLLNPKLKKVTLKQRI